MTYRTITLFSLSMYYPLCLYRSFNETNHQHLKKYYSPVGNCEEANLVSKIPAPSINASRIPPMAAEPTIATGPSTEEQSVLMHHKHTVH